ncbi:LytR cell envelope-related transcriptional attenuator [Sediminihabitans luteus]|uniref:LytR cell envelope-related transcriptional attenuator n=1 Tax=Sediminihabitans luteus TaxID=1138585 RepID=A0A2M9CEP5_9CELL|nr:LytR cell envelope-related transcriptional attenuator [Sediminihabitans luteus]GII97819.1 hypothetical protein Slu03_01970 [Sediminihabitans luteus]
MFGVIIALLAVVGVGALAVYTGAIKSPFEREFYTAPSAIDSAVVVCPPEDALPVPYPDVKVEVVNASDRLGLAGIVGDVLADRGFDVVDVSNASQSLDYVEISTNVEGLAAAYTLAAQFEESAVVLDDRAEPTVSVAIGGDFEEFVPEDVVPLEAKTPLVAPAGCHPADAITPRHVPTPTPTASEAPAAG